MEPSLTRWPSLQQRVFHGECVTDECQHGYTASEDEKDARETNAEAPPGIEMEHHDDSDVGQGKARKRHADSRRQVQGKGETGDRPPQGEEDEGEIINLEPKIMMKLEKQIQGMYQKMGEVIGPSEASMEEGSARWMRERDGDDWQRWNGAWWIKVEQQNLNSRQGVRYQGHFQGS